MKQLTLPPRSQIVMALTVLVLIGGSLAGCSPDEVGSSPSQATPAMNAQDGEPPSATTEMVYVSAEYVEYVYDTDLLVKNVHDVYIGTILSAGETFSRYGRGDVWTPFTVEVEQRLLGSVEGKITVVQMGGFDPAQNVLVIVEGDPLLEVGESYMLASRTGGNDDRPEWEDQHVVQAIKGHVRIQNAAHRQQLVQEYTDAISRAGLGS